MSMRDVLEQLEPVPAEPRCDRCDAVTDRVDGVSICVDCEQDDAADEVQS